MVLVAPDNGKAPYFHGLAVFCLLIAVACITQGRARRFVGSVVGAAIFVFTSCYLALEIATGAPLRAARSEPSIGTAALCLMFFGVPGARYAWKVRFGFGAPEVAAAPPGANVQQELERP